MAGPIPKVYSQDNVEVDSGCCFPKKKKKIPREPGQNDLTVRIGRASSGQFDAMPPLEPGTPLKRTTPINLDANGHHV